VDAPQGAPNILLVLIDDCGFGQFATFGGGIPSPTMDRLAAEGLRFNHFHTTALCSPTRAALITGRNHHSAAFAGITELATGYDGYTCILPRSCGTIGEVLRQNGYMTAWIGKNHNTPTWETSAAGPFDRWANGLGFDYFYGFNGGDMNHWNPILFENRNLVPASKDPDYHLTADLADKAIAWVRQAKAIAPDKPFFLYVAPGATHAPHHAAKPWIKKFRGKFDGGWDKYHEETIARQKKLGVIPKDTELTVRSKGLPAWSSLASLRKTQYFELGCNRGLYHDGWMVSSPSFVPWDPVREAWDPDKAPWELYDITKDFSQARDLAAKNPDKLRQLQDMWWVEAAKYAVLPLDWRAGIRMNAELMGRPSLVRGRTSMTYYPGTIALPDAASPPMCNKSWTIAAVVDVPAGDVNGMIVTHGGLEGGYGLYLRDGVPTFVYNYLGVDRPTFTGSGRIPKGKATIVVDFKYDGGGMGKGGEITMKVNGRKVAGGRMERTIPIQFSLGEGLDVGMDIGSPADFTYDLPFAFTGTIDHVRIDLVPERAPAGKAAAEAGG
jgi:arylsulfatase A-like enzyme